MKTDKEHKFVFKDNRPFKEKILDFLQSLMFWKGRKKGMIFTRNISLNELRAVFFSKKFLREISLFRISSLLGRWEIVQSIVSFSSCNGL